MHNLNNDDKIMFENQYLDLCMFKLATSVLLQKQLEGTQRVHISAK